MRLASTPLFIGSCIFPAVSPPCRYGQKNALTDQLKDSVRFIIKKPSDSGNSYEQGKLIPISFNQQIIPGTFEFALSYIVDNEIDLSVFENRYRNDATGAKAYDPAILLKVILYAYARGIISSRSIARVCEENVMFMALSADTHPTLSRHNNKLMIISI